MFSLKFDLLFPTLLAAKAIARKLNSRRAAPPLQDARDLARMRRELTASREKLKAEALSHRYQVF